MSGRRDSLTPPVRQGTLDPGAHDLAEASDSEEHYSDAQSGPDPTSPSPASPIPRTRVERVDDKPAYGEVPGTQAYRMREEDAAPDEIAIIPDPRDPSPPEPQHVGRPPTPGGHPIPKTVVEEAPDAEGAVTHPEVDEKHKSDPSPDLLVKADGQRVEKGGEAANDTPISPSLSTPPTPARSRRKSSLALKRSPLSPGSSPPWSAVTAAEGTAEQQGNDRDEEFGDDFDDFEEGDEGGDFGDFDDTSFQEAQGASAPPLPQTPFVPSLPFPVPNFEDLDPPKIYSLTAPYLDALFPPSSLSSSTPLPPHQQPPKDNPVFLTPRSASLWSQLVAPPPLQPPDWIRSRIRRLFLVSLGVPVDLDEILPASSKQKKLVLPSLRLRRMSSSSSLSLRAGRSEFDNDSPGSSVVTFGLTVPGGGMGGGGVGGSSASVYVGGSGGGGEDAHGRFLNPSAAGGGGGGGKGKKAASDSGLGRTGGGGGGNGSKGGGGYGGRVDPERLFDLVSARQACMMTDAALNGMTDDEMRAHVKRLEAMQGTAQRVLEYWQKRTDEKIGDREAFEGVIENLVKHARKVRK